LPNPASPDPRHVRGASAEALARTKLEAAGLVCLATNARFRRGEWDLVMLEQELLVFVEVRLRSHADYGGPLASVDRRKQRKLILAAALWTQQHAVHARRRIRFDVVGLHDLNAEPEWIRDAWRADR
jgi:putative endonuclease